MAPNLFQNDSNLLPQWPQLWSRSLSQIDYKRILKTKTILVWKSSYSIEKSQLFNWNMLSYVFSNVIYNWRKSFPRWKCNLSCWKRPVFNWMLFQLEGVIFLMQTFIFNLENDSSQLEQVISKLENPATHLENDNFRLEHDLFLL